MHCNDNDNDNDFTSAIADALRAALLDIASVSLRCCL